MLDNLIRLREPAAWTAIAVTAVSIVLALVRFVLASSTGVVPFSAAAQDVALHAMSLPLVIVVVALVWSCVFHAPLPGALRIVTAAALTVTIGILITIVAVVLGLTASAGTVGVVLEIVGGVLDVTLKLGGAIILWLMHRGLRGGRIDIPSAQPPVAEPGPSEATLPEARAAGASGGWTPPVATGTSWASASDAAAGAPGVDAAPASSGWHPVRSPAIDESTTGGAVAAGGAEPDARGRDDGGN
ncbi:MAG: hypothetical protein IPL36_00160 [Nigerium sp.]|nr:hypothetical protein [Nigerium sp.]